MNKLDYDNIKIRVLFILSIAAFINFNSPFYGSLFVLFFEISVINLIHITYKKQIKNHVKSIYYKELIILLLFLTIITISTLISLYVYLGEVRSFYSLIRYLEIVTHIIFCFYLSIYFTYNRQNKHFFLPVCLSICIAALVLFLDYNFNPNSIMNYEKNRIIIASNIRYLGYIAMLGCLYCIISMTLEICFKKKMYLNALFVINFSLLFWLGGRGAILALLISTLLSISLISINFILKAKSVLYTLGLMTVSCIISIPFNVYQWNGLNRFFRLSQSPDLTLDKLSTGRLDLWIESINLISENLIIGHGPEAHIFKTKIGLLQPHNFVLQFLLEFGILGTIGFIAILYNIIRMAIRNVKMDNNINNVYCYGVVVGITIHGLYDGTLYHAPPVILFIIATAYVLAGNFKLRNNFTENQINNVAIKEK
ncbi:O-antigen ligase [Vibrio sp. dhg]|uniref:O-antigen ligase family protein n=1 Tax=Vibrio sp. dhg TaxID=2163016 RepID=UPI0013C33851|nr:O-antigen ligase family protein [Vibrio sp. dhg]